MKGTGQKLILISFVLALITTFVVFIYLKSLNSHRSDMKAKTILVAADTIPPRTLISQKMVKKVQISDSSLFANCINDSNEIIGKYSKESIYKNEGFYEDKLLSQNGDDLAVKIDSNNRAISINVAGDGGVSELIKPGDFVDVIVYLSEKKDGIKVIRPDISKMILQKIKVLAINKQLNGEYNVSDKDKEKIDTNFLVTLSVPTKDVEKIVLSESIGSIKLVLRPIKNDNENKTNGTTWQELISDISEKKTSSSNNNSISKSTKTKISSNKSSKKYTSYTVKSGDTLRKISKKFYGDPDKYVIIKQANNIKEENIIVDGQIIKVPIQQ